MNKKERNELESKIYESILSGMPDKEVAELYKVSYKRVQSIRLQNSLVKLPREHTIERLGDRLTHFHEEKKIVGVPFEYQGHKYIDITGDIVDCGIAYRRNNND